MLFLARTYQFMFQIKVNNNDWQIELNVGKTLVNGKETSVDISGLSENEFHVLHEQRSYNVILIEMNREEKTCVLRVNGNDYIVSVKDNMDLLLQQLGMNNLASLKVNDLKAPMPGKVLSINVTAGTQLKKGDTVLILEAMKMENVLKSSGDTTVKEIKVKQGDTVEKNQVLVIME
jgi:biotin carboxyl carrier protein